MGTWGMETGHLAGEVAQDSFGEDGREKFRFLRVGRSEIGVWRLGNLVAVGLGRFGFFCTLGLDQVAVSNITGYLDHQIVHLWPKYHLNA